MNVTTTEYAAFFEKLGKQLTPKASDPKHWVTFVDALRHSLPSDWTGARSLSQRSWSAGDFLKFFILLRKGVNEDLKSGNRVRVWEVAKLGNDEMRNSYVLRWLLDYRESHGQKDLFLKALLGWVWNELKVPQCFPSCSDLGDGSYWTKVESHPLGEKESRVDIEIGGPIVLFLEVKVNSRENGDQINRYVERAERKAGNRKWGVLYLTKTGKPPADPSVRDRIVPISWTQISKLFHNLAGTKLAKGSLTRYLVEEFCSHIKKI